MAYTVKIRTLPGSPMLCEYECPVHGRLELLVTRDANGDPPAVAECEHAVGNDACEMMVGGMPADVTPCGATPTVGGNEFYRYCAKHMTMVLAAGSKAAEYDEGPMCCLPAELIISAPNIKFWSRDPVAVERASKSDEEDPRMLDTEPLATGKMTKAEWKKYQHGITLERRHQKLLKSGKRSKRIQVGGG